MSNSHSSLSKLKQTASDASNSLSQEEKLETLTRAFELFSEETKRLESAYAKLQKEYEEINKYLNSILENMSQGLIFIQEDGVITTYNPAAEKHLGKKAQEVQGHPFSQAFSDDFFGFSIKECLKEKAGAQRVYKTLEAEESKQLEIETSFVDQAPNGIIILIRDITQLRKLEEIANRNDRMKELGQMAALVAHEIRNPLGGIKGFASLLIRDLQDQPNQKEMLEHIIQGTDDLNRLVTNVLNYSRPLKLELTSTDLCSLLKETVDHLQADKELVKKTAFDLQIPRKAIHANIDAGLIRSILLNLIVNGIQAMPEGGEISIQLTDDEELFYISIADTGVGIPEQNIEKIFTPFFTTKPKGHGFGLSEVYRIIQEHGGTIDVDSRAGHGTAFIVKLPHKGYGCYADR